MVMAQTNGHDNEVVVRVNKQYLKAFWTIAGAAISILIAVVGFIVRVEVNAATMHQDIQQTLEKIEHLQDSQSKLKGSMEYGFESAAKDRKELRDDLETERIKRLKGDKGRE